MTHWTVTVRWPDRRQLAIDVRAADAAEAEKYCVDVWGSSISTTVVPKEEID